MPRTKSAKKMLKVAEKRRAINRSTISAVKTHIRTAEKLIVSKELDPARAAVLQATSALDRAAQKGIIHPNNAARRKSRLLKKFNTAFPPAPPQ